MLLEPVKLPLEVALAQLGDKDAAGPEHRDRAVVLSLAEPGGLDFAGHLVQALGVGPLVGALQLGQVDVLCGGLWGPRLFLFGGVWVLSGVGVGVGVGGLFGLSLLGWR
jgi:hypothetical protein